MLVCPIRICGDLHIEIGDEETGTDDRTDPQTDQRPDAQSVRQLIAAFQYTVYGFLFSARHTIGPFLCAREAVKRRVAGGAIVVVSSLAAKTGAPHEYVDYAASKAALDTLTVGLSKEWRLRVSG